MTTPFPPRKYYVRIVSWAGVVKHPVQVIKWNPSRTRVRWLDDSPKGKAGQVGLVPTGTIDFDE